MKRFWAPAILLSLFLLPLSAAASPVPASAVLASCGQPSSDYQSTSPITSQTERTLIYGATILHFQPSPTGWSYLSAWKGHTPIFESTVAKQMPCFAAALSSVAALPTSTANPVLAANQIVPDNRTIPDTGIRFNKAFLWLLFALAAILLITFARPGKKRLAHQYLPLETRPFHRPKVDPTMLRRRPRIDLPDIRR